MPDKRAEVTLMNWLVPMLDDGASAPYTSLSIAQKILGDPQGLVNVLAEAAALVEVQLYRGEFDPEPAYVVAKPHVHDWRHDITCPNRIICAGCKERRPIPTMRLADLPKYDGEP